MLSEGFSTFFAANPGVLDCTAHSHHPWPDVALAAHARYAEDSMRLTNAKWDRVLGEVLPRARAHVAAEIGWAQPRDIAFAPNTHEFVVRLYSCLGQVDAAARPTVVSSAHEFHSFGRQTRRYEEAGRIRVVRVAAAPHADFTARLVEAVERERPAMVFVSHVFFDSGLVVQDLPGIVAAARRARDNAIVVIDGYHAYCALPVDVSAIAADAFYLAGGYKYAMAGEGACWMAMPAGCRLRPENTGWFADFDALSRPQGGPVTYAQDGMRFWGATFDASGLYRMVAVREWLGAAGVGTAAIHAHAQRLQARFLEHLARRAPAGLEPARLTPPVGVARGNFLTFDTPAASILAARLAEAGIRIDQRGTRIRFGFGVYQEADFADRLAARLEDVAAA
jgi:selenocysteine lyase/cysteine desulfurase